MFAKVMAAKVNQPEENPPKPPAPQQGGSGGYLAGKSAWPELIGLTKEEAERKIKEETPENTRVHVVPSDSFVTMDFRTDRVRIFVDTSGKVVKSPIIG